MAAEIRELRWTDFESLVAGYLPAYDERARGEPIGIVLFDTPPTIAAEMDWFAGMFRRVLDGATIARVADDAGTAVGLCTIERAGPGARTEVAHVGVLGVYVRASHRGRGIGRALIAAVLEAASGTFSVVKLDVFATNPKAQRLYESFGFVECGRLPRAVRRGAAYVESVQMVRLA